MGEWEVKNSLYLEGEEGVGGNRAVTGKRLRCRESLGKKVGVLRDQQQKPGEMTQ